MHGLTKYDGSFLAFGHDRELSRNQRDAPPAQRRALDVVMRIASRKAFDRVQTWESGKFWPAWIEAHQEQMNLYRTHGAEKYAVQGEVWLAKRGPDE